MEKLKATLPSSSELSQRTAVSATPRAPITSPEGLSTGTTIRFRRWSRRKTRRISSPAWAASASLQARTGPRPWRKSSR